VLIRTKGTPARETESKQPPPEKTEEHLKAKARPSRTGRSKTGRSNTTNLELPTAEEKSNSKYTILLRQEDAVTKP